MPLPMSAAVRNAMIDAIENAIGASPTLRIRTGTPPATAAAASTGTVLATINLPADWMAGAANGIKAMLGSWAATVTASGTPGQFEIVGADATVHVRGAAGVQVQMPTSAATAANGNVLTFAATAGISAGMNVSGAGIPAGATVAAVTGTTVTLSMTATAGVASGASITFAPELVLDAATFTAGQNFSVTAFSFTGGNA